MFGKGNLNKNDYRADMNTDFFSKKKMPELIVGIFFLFYWN